MKIIPKIEIDVPKGIYCGGCNRKGSTPEKERYCEVFWDGLLEKDCNGRYLKCEQCLLETREALINDEV